MASSTWIAIAIGGAAGAATAFLAASGRTPPDAPPKLAPVAAKPVPTPTPTRAPPNPLQAPLASASARAEASAGERPASGSAAAPEVVSAPGAAAVMAAPAPASVRTREELSRLEVACQEKREPAACRAAALAYEEGSVAPDDPAKARLFRRIELTFLVKQCEGQIASACGLLADRYEKGDGVAQSSRSAEALRARVKELCANRKGAGCP